MTDKLIYFWLDYEKIFNGFVEIKFCRKYFCEFDGVINNFRVKLNEELEEESFGKNINFSVLVGENGTGKSTILRILKLILSTDEVLINVEYKYFIVFSDGSFKSNLKYEDDEVKNTNFLRIKGKLHTGNTMVKMYDAEKAFEKARFLENINLHPKQIFKLIKQNIQWNDENKFELFLYKPKYLLIELKSLHDLYKEALSYSYLCLDNNSVRILCEYLYPYNVIKDEIQLYCIFNEFLSNPKSFIEDLTNIDIEENIDKIVSNDINLFTKIYDLVFDSKMDLDKLDRELKSNILMFHNLFYIDFQDKNHVKYTELSLGQKTAFAIFLNVDEMTRDFNKTSIMLLDEPEISFHPDWQRKLIDNLVVNFSEKKNHVHFIISTHSPHILSDIPNFNITYLINKDGKGFVYKDKIDKTFGLNIHTLLSNHFFLKENLMGAFSYRIIKDNFELTEKYLDDEIYYKGIELTKETYINIHKKEIKNLINIIGEEYLKSELNENLKYIDIKFDIQDEFLSNKDKLLKAIDNDPVLLEKMIREIK